MNFTNIDSKLQKLSRADKLKAMQFLIVELAKEEIQLQPNATYSVVSPYNSHQAAHELSKLL